MASIRGPLKLKDGTTYTQVLYRLDGKQTSASFGDHAEAVKFCELANRTSPAKALEVWRAERQHGTTVAQWAQHHIEHLNIGQATIKKYREYLRNDIEPSPIGGLPLGAVTRDDIALWIGALAARGNKHHTIANKHGFLSGAFNAASLWARWAPTRAKVSTYPPPSRRKTCSCRTSSSRCCATMSPNFGARWSNFSSRRAPGGAKQRRCGHPMSTVKKAPCALSVRGATTTTTRRGQRKPESRGAPSTFPQRCSTSSTIPMNGCSSTASAIGSSIADFLTESGRPPSHAQDWTRRRASTTCATRARRG
jgi:hypothetical protein